VKYITVIIEILAEKLNRVGIFYGTIRHILG